MPSYANDVRNDRNLNVWKVIVSLAMAGAAVLALLFLGWLFLVQSVKPDAGFEAVLIKKPMLFGQGGIDPTPVKTGRVYTAVTTDAVLVDMRPFVKGVQVKDMMTSNGVPIDFAAVIRLQAVDSVKLHSKFGADWYRINVEPTFLRFVRDAVKKHGMNEVAITAAAGETIDKEVEDRLRRYLIDIDLPVKLWDVTLGRANPPDAVLTQREETARMEQSEQTQQKSKLSQDARRAAELSRAAADNAYREAMQMSPEQFLELERIKQFAAVCGGGKCNIYVTGGGVVPVLSVK